MRVSSEQAKIIKSNSRIEQVMREQGLTLEEQPGQGTLVCVERPGLLVDVDRQLFSLGEERGDIINWLRLEYGWTFGRAVEYLINRGRMSAEEREKYIKPVRQAIPGKRAGKPGKTWPDVHDRQIRGLWGLLGDYTGIEGLLVSTPQRVIGERAWIPSRFAAVVGDFSGELCSWCYREPKGWEETRWFYAFELGENYEIQQSSGIYCADCVARFRRWNEGFTRLIGILAAEERKTQAPAGSFGWAST